MENKSLDINQDMTAIDKQLTCLLLNSLISLNIPIIKADIMSVLSYVYTYNFDKCFRMWPNL